jgi:hypothetical protein
MNLGDALATPDRQFSVEGQSALKISLTKREPRSCGSEASQGGVKESGEATRGLISRQNQAALDPLIFDEREDARAPARIAAVFPFVLAKIVV